MESKMVLFLTVYMGYIYFVNYAIKRHLRKFGIKNETFCFLYLTIIIIFVAKLKNFIGNLHLNKR